MAIDTQDVYESSTSPLLDQLTMLETQVVKAARWGDWAEPDTVLPVDEIATTEDVGLRVRAALIRELLMGRRGELDPRGLRIRGVRVVGPLDLDHVTAITGLALDRCALPDGVVCVYARMRELDLSGSHLSGLNADGLRTDSGMFLRGVNVAGRGPLGGLRLRSAYIGGQLSLDHVEIINESGPALDVTDLRTDSAVFLQGVLLRGHGGEGTLLLPDAHIGGQLNLRRVEITNESGPALNADDLRTDSGMFLRDVTVVGSGESGAARLPSAHIGGQPNLDRVLFANDTGPALNADGLRTDDDMFLRDVTVTGAGESGALRLPGAHIGGQLHLDGIRVSNESGLLIDLSEAQLSGVLSMPVSVVCPQVITETPRGGCLNGQRRIAVRGLVFPMLAGVTWRQWLHVLMHHTSVYMAQPYQQLAAAERSSGHDNNVRGVLIAQQEALRRRVPEALGGRLARARHWLWGSLIGYGYRVDRLISILALILALSASLAYIAGHVATRPGHYAAERISATNAAGRSGGAPCSVTELIGLGIDRGLPLGATGLRANCDLDTKSQSGQVFNFAIVLLQALAWTLATLALAAYAGLIRRPT